MIKTKEFIGVDEYIEEQINRWIEENNIREIIDIKYSITYNGISTTSGCLIIYKSNPGSVKIL